MKKSKLNILLISAALFIYHYSTAFSSYDDRYDYSYISATGALAFRNDKETFLDSTKTGNEFKNKMGGGASLAIGQTLGCWRAELEGLFITSKTKDFTDFFNGTETGVNQSLKGHMRNYAIMANLYYDLPVYQCLSFYLGGGIGASFNQIKMGKITDKNALFAWQLLAGVTYDINNRWAITAGYRLFATTKPKMTIFDNQNKLKKVSCSKMPIINSFEIGLRYKF